MTLARFESDGSSLSVIESHRAVFIRQKAFAEHAMNQLDDVGFFRSPGDGLNSVAVIAQHLGGNLRSRWTDFLTTDGEKPSRDREEELTRPTVTDAASMAAERARIMGAWDAGWAALFATLAGLCDDDLGRTVTIRGAPHSVALALTRCLDHMAFHVGQMNTIARLYVGSEHWAWFTLAPGTSRAFNEAMRAKHGER